MKHLNLCEHHGGDMSDRFTINSVRVARHVFRDVEYMADRKFCFLTDISLKTGRIRNHKTVVVADGVHSRVAA